MLKLTSYFGKVSFADWNSPQWQNHNSIISADSLRRLFPSFPPQRLEAIDSYCKDFRLRVTPYALELMQADPQGFPTESDPCWLQLFPPVGFQFTESRPDGFGAIDNWEPEGDMVTPIGQHKYTNRICIRMVGRCPGYCTFCFEALRTTDKRDSKQGPADPLWEQTLEYIRATKTVEEVVFSGGEPLTHSNEQLDRYLTDVRTIDHVRFIRFHTRYLTFVPMRMDDDLASIFRRQRVNAVHLHVAHPREIQTEEFIAAVDRIREVGKVKHIRSHTPLLRGVNDSLETLEELFFGLYELGIDPYYLIHSFPNIPTAHYHRLPVRKGIEIMNALKRHKTNPAVPEYIICHPSGKHTVPLTLESIPGYFEYCVRGDGWPVIRYRNWKGEWVEYLDCPD